MEAESKIQREHRKWMTCKTVSSGLTHTCNQSTNRGQKDQREKYKKLII